jgi:tungstate transport system ATP-binding protein
MAEPTLLPISIEGLSFMADGRRVLEGVAARIATPGITAVIGANGAGKSVLLRLIDGLIAPNAGAIRFGRRDAAMVRRGFVFQKTALLRASVAQNVALALAPLALARTERARRVDAALLRVGLASRAKDPARRLSGGEQQRLGLARAWVIEPELLLLDEPTASLDPGATEEVERLVRIMADARVKVILVSHNLAQVARLAEDVLVLSKGRVVEHGSVHQVLRHPVDAETRAYLKGELPWMPYAAGS